MLLEIVASIMLLVQLGVICLLCLRMGSLENELYTTKKKLNEYKKDKEL